MRYRPSDRSPSARFLRQNQFDLPAELYEVARERFGLQKEEIIRFAEHLIKSENLEVPGSTSR